MNFENIGIAVSLKNEHEQLTREKAVLTGVLNPPQTPPDQFASPKNHSIVIYDGNHLSSIKSPEFVKLCVNYRIGQIDERLKIIEDKIKEL